MSKVQYACGSYAERVVLGVSGNCPIRSFRSYDVRIYAPKRMISKHSIIFILGQYKNISLTNALPHDISEKHMVGF